MSRLIVWFSCGAASATAAKIVLTKRASYEADEIIITRCVIDSEHPDNDRFARDCEIWFDHPIVNLRNEKYATHWEVLEAARFISSPAGAPCTAELKKIPRFQFQQPDDIHVFGYTFEEKRRLVIIKETNFDLQIRAPLIEEGLSKSDCYAIIKRAGIELPAMYKLGFNNNNCIGCAKAGSAGYWNRIRRMFPEAFDRMARLQRELDYTQVTHKGKAIFLDELNPRIRENREPDIECSILCRVLDAEFKRG